MNNVLIAVMCAAIVSAGCRVDTTPRTVAEWSPDQRTGVIEAKYTGEYKLYKLPEGRIAPPDEALPPVLAVRLKKGVRLGFSVDARGRATAVAGDDAAPLEDGLYEWVMQPDPDEVDLEKTLRVTGTIVVGVALIIGAVAVLAFAISRL